MYRWVNLTKNRVIAFLSLLVILFSSITTLSVNIENKCTLIDSSQRIADANISDISFEILVNYSRASHNKSKAGLKACFNERTTLFSLLLSEDDIYITLVSNFYDNISDLHFTHDIILIYIHSIDGKKQLI